MEEFLLSIAGFDPSGGAGVIRDVSVFSGLKKSARAVITSFVLQDGKRVRERIDFDRVLVREQIRESTRYGRLKGIKVGVLGNLEVAKEVVRFLKEVKGIPVVIDPVLYSSDGYPLLDEDAYTYLLKKVFPLATVVTPNLSEAIILSENRDVKKAGEKLSEYTEYVVITAGKDMGGDFIFKGGKLICKIRGRKYKGDIHGSGCVYSSTLLAYLSEGVDITTACKMAKRAVAYLLKGS